MTFYLADALLLCYYSAKGNVFRFDSLQADKTFYRYTLVLFQVSCSGASHCGGRKAESGVW